MITFSDCEGAGETFQIAGGEQFFGSTAHLSVSSQLHGEIAANSAPRVYTFGPTFRAEKHNTVRHLSEFWMLEPEVSFIDSLGQLMSCIEAIIIQTTDRLLQSASSELGVICGAQSNTLEIQKRWAKITAPFTRMTYSEAISSLEGANVAFTNKVSWGLPLQLEHEKFLADNFVNGPVFITDYPAEIKAFYMKANPDQKTVACCDLLVPGLAELVGGSLREDNEGLLREKMAKLEFNADNYAWYLDLRRYGGVPHGGFGLGFERYLQYITGIQNIRDVCLIPRYGGNNKF